MIKIDFDERDLRSLRVFCSVAQAGGFAAAEQALLMSKASISRHVREVEERLGVRLCERGPSGFHLTPEGVVALELASSALRSLARIRPEIDAVHGVLSGRLVIGIGEYASWHHDFKLSQALAQCKQRAPLVEPEISLMRFTELNQALRMNKVDIAIRGHYQEDSEFSYLPLYLEEHYIYALHADAQLPLVYREHPYVHRALQETALVAGPTAEGLESIGLLIASGDYCGLLPSHFAQQLRSCYPLVRLRHAPSYSHQICAVTAPDHPMTHRARFFLQLLADLHPDVALAA